MIVIHGDDLVKSSQFLEKLIGRYLGWQVVRVNLKIEPFDPITLFLTDSLFEEKKLVILENFYKFFKNLPLDLAAVGDVSNLEIVIFENEQLRPSQLKSLPPKTQVFLFKPEPIIFRFFDHLIPGNQRVAFKLFKQIESHYDPYLFFALFTKHIKHLLLAKTGGELNLESWQVEKYARLAAKFKRERLISAYRGLFQIEVKIKRGEISNPMPALSLLSFELTRS